MVIYIKCLGETSGELTNFEPNDKGYTSKNVVGSFKK